MMGVDWVFCVLLVAAIGAGYVLGLSDGRTEAKESRLEQRLEQLLDRIDHS